MATNRRSRPNQTQQQQTQQYVAHWNINDTVGANTTPDKYTIIGMSEVTGGMSQVYKVRDNTLGQIWCYKEVVVNNNNNFSAMLAEALIMKKLKNIYIPSIIDIFYTHSPDEPDNWLARLGIVMSWVDGRSLQSIITETGPIRTEMAVQWGIQLCKILEHLHTDTRTFEYDYVAQKQYVTSGHAPILYRDLKPSNIMILEKESIVNILDFGISLEIVDEGATIESTYGTPGYAPPEFYYKDSPIDLRSDIYTLGATLYHMLTGVAPIDKGYTPASGKPPVIKSMKDQQAVLVPPELEAIIMRALAFDPDDRYETATDMRIALERVASNYDEKLKDYRRKVTAAFILFVLSVICLSGALIPFYISQNSKNQNYKALVQVAELSKDPEDYKKAIASRPNVVDPYIGLIDAYIQQKGGVTEDDVMVLKDYLYPNKDNMTDQDHYGELCYKVGEMYWYYYDAQKNTTRPEVLAKPWFEEAVKYDYEATKANVLVKIGNYWKQKSSLATQSTDKLAESYREYWENLLSAKMFIEDDDEILKYQTYAAISECIYNNAYQLLQSGVTEQALRDEVKELQAFVQQAKTTTQLTKRTRDAFEDLNVQVPELSEKITIATRGGAYGL